MKTLPQGLLMLCFAGCVVTGPASCKTVDWLQDKIGKGDKQEQDWRTGPGKIPPAGDYTDWECVVQLRDMPHDRPATGAAERGLLTVRFDVCYVDLYTMPGDRNCWRIRMKYPSDETRNVRCGDAMWAPIPSGEVELRLSVSGGKFDVTCDGVRMGRRGVHGSRKDYLPIAVCGAVLDCIIVDQWAGDGRVMGGKWRAGEVREAGGSANAKPTI